MPRTTAPTPLEINLTPSDAAALQGVLSEHLRPGRIEALARLAEIRGETIDETVVRLLCQQVRSIPRRIGPRDLGPCDLQITDAGDIEGTPYVSLRNGRTFFGLPPNPKYVDAYYLLRDLLPPSLTAMSFYLAKEIRWRYANLVYRGIPGAGGVIVEAGAYTGLKAIGFADRVGPTGTVMAIELMPGNVELMRRNVTANGLDDVVIPLNYGIWNEPGETLAMSKGFQQNSLVEIEGREYGTEVTVPTESIDNMLDAHDIERVDFLNMQINGAEIEGIEGLQRRIGDIKLLRIAAYYTRDGERTVQRVCDMLESFDCTILYRNERGNLYAMPNRQMKADPDFVRQLERTRSDREKEAWQYVNVT